MSESLTGIVARGAFWSSSANIVTKLLGLATMAIILRTLSVREYGTVELVMSIPPLLSIFTLPGLSNVVIADMGRARGIGDYSEMRRLFVSYFRLVFFLSLVPAVCVVLATMFFLETYDPSVRHMFQMVSSLFFFTVFTTSTSILLRVFLKFEWAAWNSTMYEVVKLSLIAVLFFTWKAEPVAVVLANIGADLGALLFSAPRTLSLYRTFRNAPLKEAIKPFTLLRGHGKWGVAASYAGSLGQYIRPWLIKFTLGTEAVGLFAAAQGLIQHTFSLMPLASLIQPMLPQYAHDKEHYFRVIRKFVKYQMVTAGAIAIAGCIAFPPILGVLFPKYVASFDLYRVMLLIFATYAVSPVLSGVFFAAQQQKSLTMSTLIRTAATAILLPPLALVFGIYGVALEYLLTTYLFQIERFIATKKFLPDFRLDLRSLIRFDEYDQLLWTKVKNKVVMIRK